MQSINISLPKIIEARDTHYQFMRYIIKKKLNGNIFDEEPPIPEMNNINKARNIELLNQEVLDYLNNDENLKLILIGTPDELDAIKTIFQRPEEIETIIKIINYKSWINFNSESTYQNYSAYNLAENLDIPTCVYCNRIYTKTVISSSGKKIVRPTFDHWFPKSDFPLLALSFYNLIPSCFVCNSGLKGGTKFLLYTHFHPYYKSLDHNFKYTFSYDHRDYDKFTFKILTENKFSNDTVRAFELEEIYKVHEDEIEDLRKIKDAYSEEYIEMLERNIVKGIPLDRNQVYRLAFGVHFEEANFDRRPLSKMKKDILIELGIIKEE